MTPPLYGPHCDHPECAWDACDHAPTEEAGVLDGCRQQGECPLCGPASQAWPRLVGEWLTWAQAAYGPTRSARLAAPGVPPNVVAPAQLIEANPPRSNP